MTDYEDTIFDKIIAGKIPCAKVYEDEHVFAFLDISPLAPGHTLVLPKEKKRHLHELSDEAAAALGRALRRLCPAIMRAAGAEAYNVLVNTGEAAGQVVMHVHVHVIPRLPEAGLRVRWDAGQLEPDAARQIAEEIQHQLGAA